MQIQCSEESVRDGPGPVGSGHRLTLTLLKILHTAIWTLMTTANFAGFYLSLVGRFDWWFYSCVALLSAEIMVIVVNRWHCPLTDVMAKYTTERKANFDIYLPEWLARNNVKIFSVLIILEIMIVLIHRISRLS
jgi:hypothetical protein